jgi:hypothetical protein
MSGTFTQPNPWGVSAFGTHGIGTFPGTLPSQSYAQPFTTTPFAGYGFGISSVQQPLQQIVQSLQIIPQQLQHLLQLAYAQQQQAQYLMQFIPHQLQQLQQQLLAHAGFQPVTAQQAFGAPFTQIPGGLAQPFGTQPGYVM